MNLLIRSFSRRNFQSNFTYNITPYWHVLYFHTKEILERHEEIASFSNQPNEKLQHSMKICYVRSTNKKKYNKKYLKQLLKKRNRLEFYFLQIQTLKIFLITFFMRVMRIQKMIQMTMTKFYLKVIIDFWGIYVEKSKYFSFFINMYVILCFNNIDDMIFSLLFRNCMEFVLEKPL